MVHALQETWRVLAVAGSLIDLRPLAGQSRVEVVDDNQILFAGLVDETGDEPDDIAADEALAQIVSKDRFVLEQQTFFDYSMYWDTPGEMKAYGEAHWKKSRLPEDVLVKTQHFVTSSNIATKVRIRRRMMIARYRKLTQIA